MADTPLDTYFAEHPEELLQRDNEPLAVSLQNRRLVCHHLACSIQEMGDEDAVDLGIMGDDVARALQLRRGGRLSDEVFYSDDPHMRTPVRNTESRNYRLMVGDQEIGEIDPWHLIREAYPHGIYLHGGNRYRVKDIFKSTREIRLAEERSWNLTDPHIHKAVYTRRVRAVMKYPHLLVKMANFEVTESLVAVCERNPNGDTIRQYAGSQGLAPHRLPTEGISIELLPELCTKVAGQIQTNNWLPVIHAIERLLRGLFPVISGPCDTMDFDTFSEARQGKVSWYLYDRVPDGIDLTIRAYRRVSELVSKAMDRVESCRCPDDIGCFRCIRNPYEDEISSKTNCVRVLSVLCEAMASKASEEVVDFDALDQDPQTIKCPVCDAPVGPGNRFCGNCGEQLEEQP